MKYWKRLKDKNLHALSWPFIIATTFYGVGFVLLPGSTGVEKSSLFQAMITIGSNLPLLWGLFALLVIALGALYLFLDIEVSGRISGVLGTILWLFAGLCWLVTGGWLLFFAVALPEIWFWTWVYLRRTP